MDDLGLDGPKGLFVVPRDGECRRRPISTCITAFTRTQWPNRRSVDFTPRETLKARKGCGGQVLQISILPTLELIRVFELIGRMEVTKLMRYRQN
jgi:hypothetical protein